MNVLDDIQEFLEDLNKVKNGYVSVKPLEKEKLYNELKDIFKDTNITVEDRLHITVSFSRVSVKDLKAKNYETIVTPVKYELLGDDKSCVVLLVKSDVLENRHKEIIDMGATYDWDKYQPHLTISYKVVEDFDLSKLKLPKPFKVGLEEVEDLDDDWV